MDFQPETAVFLKGFRWSQGAEALGIGLKSEFGEDDFLMAQIWYIFLIQHILVLYLPPTIYIYTVYMPCIPSLVTIEFKVCTFLDFLCYDTLQYLDPLSLWLETHFLSSKRVYHPVVV